MNTNFYHYILGITPIDNFRLMKWAQTNLSKFDGERSIKDISDEIQTMISNERKQWAPFLKKSVYHLTTAVSVVLFVGALVEFGRFFISRSPVKYFLNEKIQNALAVSSILSGLFHQLHRKSLMDTRLNVQLKINSKYPTLKVKLKDWLDKRESHFAQLTSLLNKAQEFQKTENDEQQKQAAQVSYNKIEKARK